MTVEYTMDRRRHRLTSSLRRVNRLLASAHALRRKRALTLRKESLVRRFSRAFG